jgi:uncharacterized protein YndB with AHSA1/START domain
MSARKDKPNEITITRIYDAPVRAVWEAWTDVKQVEKWWGPRGFTLTTHGKDLRPGGHWTYTMHGPDGTDYPNKTIYHEVEKHSRLVYDHGGNDDRPPLFRVTATFEELKGNRTKLVMTMALATAEAAAEIKKFIKKAGGEGTWDRLAEFLAEREGKNCFVINRSFDAPLERVFERLATHCAGNLKSDEPEQIALAFTAEGPNRTRVTVTSELRGTTDRGGMAQGWTGSFDKLEEALEKGQA